MRCRIWLVAAIAWCGCGPPPRSADSLLPASVGVWQRTSIRGLPPPKPAILRVFEAGYQGGGRLTVDLYEAKISGTAFEMAQHWREAPNTVFFDKGRYFAVVRWEQADRQALTAFVRALQKDLGQP